MNNRRHVLNARKICMAPPEQISELKGPFDLVFEDGQVISTNARETIYSYWLWGFHRMIPDLPLLPAHHVKNYIKPGGLLRHNSHVGICSDLENFAVRFLTEKQAMTLDMADKLAELCCRMANDLYNDMSVRTSRWVATSDHDLTMELMLNPELMSIIESAQMTESGIGQMQRKVREWLEKSPAIADNPNVQAIRAGVVRALQVVQLYAPIGIFPDADSQSFLNCPITRGYGQGIRSLAELMVESCSAKVALLNTTKPLQTAEYANRRQQMVTMSLKRVHWGDCGSTAHLNVVVTRKQVDENENVVSPDVLEAYEGAYFLDEEIGRYRPLRCADTHLYDKMIKVRSVVAGCNHPDPAGVCTTCVGSAVELLPKYSNLGHASCVSLNGVINQLIMSTKHYFGSIITESIRLNELTAKYLKLDNQSSIFTFKPKSPMGDEAVLYFNKADAVGLPMFYTSREITAQQFQPAQVGSFVHATLAHIQDEDVVTVPLEIGASSRKAEFSVEFMEHIRKVGYTSIDSSNAYSVDLSQWDQRKPIFTLPSKNYDMADHQAKLSKMLESSALHAERRFKTVDPGGLLQDFIRTAGTRLKVNFSVASVMVYSHMAVSVEKNNYDLPKGSGGQVGVLKQVIRARSLAAYLAFENQADAIASPRSYLSEKRHDHPMDVFFYPEMCNPVNEHMLAGDTVWEQPRTQYSGYGEIL